MGSRTGSFISLVAVARLLFITVCLSSVSVGGHAADSEARLLQLLGNIESELRAKGELVPPEETPVDPATKARVAGWDAEAAGRLSEARQHFQTACKLGDRYSCGMGLYVDAEQAQAAGDASREHEARASAVKAFYSACVDRDALACSKIATDTYLTTLVSDAQRGPIRKMAARAAAQQYDQGCATAAIKADCLRLANHVRAARNIDSRMPETERTDGLKDFTAKSAEVFLEVCGVSPNRFGTDCMGAVQMLDVADKPRATKVRDALCADNLAFACHDLGRLSAAEREKDLAETRACEGGSGAACERQSRFWYDSTWSQQRLEKSRAAARTGCDVGYAQACLMWGQFVASGEGGTADVHAGLAAFDKACSLGGPGSTGCRYAALVRQAISEGKQIQFR